jgi:hypothetical protein
MKKLITILSLITLFTSCGKKSSSESSNGRTTDPVIDSIELTKSEKALKDSLLDKGELNQKDLMKAVLELNALDQGTLKKLDQYINVKCIQESGMCYITEKE